MFIHFFVNFKKDDNLILIFSAFKMNYFYKEIHISFTMIMNESSIYLVIMLYILFNHFSAKLKVSLFAKIFDSFSRDHFIKIIRNAFLDVDFNLTSFSDHFFRKETTISAIAANISHDEIKIMGK